MRNPNCTKCGLYNTCQTACVWGNGPSNAKIMFVGEAPGSDEDLIGQPFVGRAGKKLDEMLTTAGLNRADVYVSNICKCRPPENREPTSTEIKMCAPYIEDEIATVKPKVIVPMGNPALRYFLGVVGVTTYAGHLHESDKYGCKIIPLLHPAYILRVPEHTRMVIAHLRKIKSIAEGQQATSSVKYVTVRTLNQAEILFKRLREVKIFSMDIETSGFDFLHDKILCIGFSWRNNTAVTLPLLGKRFRQIWNDKELNYIMTNLKEVLEGPAQKILQNGSFDYKFLRSYGIHLNNFDWDTMLMHHLLDENLKGFHGLKSMAITYTDMGNYEASLQKALQRLEIDAKNRRNERIKTIKTDDSLSKTEKTALINELRKTKIDISYAELEEDMLWLYQSQDVDATFRVRNELEKELREESQTKLGCSKRLIRLFRQIVMPQRNILNEMEYKGALLDIKYIEELDKKYSAEIEKLRHEFAKLPEIKAVEKVLYDVKAVEIGKRYDDRKVKPKNVTRDEYIEKYTKPIPFNPESPKHLQILLFNVLGLTPISKSEKTGEPSTDKDTLIALAEQSPICQQLLNNRHLVKFYSTYVVGMREKVDENGRIHTDFNSHGTTTGRLSSSNPNLQNIPRGSDIKKIFIAPEGWDLIQFDFSQAEFRMWAQYSQDQKMIADIRNGMDIHKQTASDFWNIPLDQVTKEQRNQAKFVVFGLMYGRGVKSVAKQVGITEVEAEGIIKYFFNKYPTAKQWLRDTQMFAKQHHYTVNHFGRIRRLPILQFQNDVREERSGLIAEALRRAVNAPIQSASADIVGIGMIRIDKILSKGEFKAFPVLTVHDSIVYECPKEETLDFAKVGYRELTRKIEGIVVPLDVEVQVGQNWLEMKEIKVEI